jgi:hypothetical protein
VVCRDLARDARRCDGSPHGNRRRQRRPSHLHVPRRARAARRHDAAGGDSAGVQGARGEACVAAGVLWGRDTVQAFERVCTMRGRGVSMHGTTTVSRPWGRCCLLRGRPQADRADGSAVVLGSSRHVGPLLVRRLCPPSSGAHSPIHACRCRQPGSQTRSSPSASTVGKAQAGKI